MCLVESHWITSRKKSIAQWIAGSDATSIIWLVLSQLYAKATVAISISRCLHYWTMGYCHVPPTMAIDHGAARPWRNLTMCRRSWRITAAQPDPSQPCRNSDAAGSCRRCDKKRDFTLWLHLVKMECLLVRLVVVQQCDFTYVSLSLSIYIYDYIDLRITELPGDLGSPS